MGHYYRPGASYRGHPMGRTVMEQPIYDGSKWDWKDCRELYLTREGVDQWKTHFYNIEEWDKDTGYPKRQTLEDLGMKHVADLLQANNRLGSA